jgi:glycosyltransferase involved in cell wall biosynthesis
MTDVPPLVALIDLSSETSAEATAVLDHLKRHDVLGGCATRAIVLVGSPLAGVPELPCGWRVEAVPAALAGQWAFDMAADEDTALLIVSGGVRPTSEAVAALQAGLLLDPLFGIAVPRVSVRGRARIVSPEGWHGRGSLVPLAVLAEQAEFRVLPEMLAPCLLVRRELTGNLAVVAGGWQTLGGLLADFAVRARRAGFRTVLCNRAIVEVPRFQSAGLPIGRADMAAMRATHPDLPRTSTVLGSAAPWPAERLLAAMADRPDSLLLDARNLGSVYNGTSAAILQLADAMYGVRRDERITLWAHKDAAEWHDLAERYPRWSLHVDSTLPDPSAAAIRVSQPWHTSEIESLNQVAAVTAYWMLDNIAWDIVYSAPERLDAVWERLIRQADAILFISEFSRRRFANRFSLQPGVTTGVCRLSLAPGDYQGPVAADGPRGPYWLVVGNRYDHKHVAPTVDLLTRAFPARRLVVFGDRQQPRTSLVTRFDSGAVDEATVQACYAGAEIVVFPSFYEGFGMPIIQGLARGCTVVARESALVSELAELYRGPGRLVTFATERQLIERLNRLERGEAVQESPLGSAAPAAPWTWTSAATHMLDMVRELVAASPSRQMLARTGLGRGLTHPYRSTSGTPERHRLVGREFPASPERS